MWFIKVSAVRFGQIARCFGTLVIIGRFSGVFLSFCGLFQPCLAWLAWADLV